MEIEKIINDYGDYIYNYALRLTCHPQDAEDIASQTFINAWKSLDSLKNEEFIKAWLRKICFNSFLMKIRKNKFNEEIISDILEDAELESDSYMYVSYNPKPEDEILVAEEIRELQNGCFMAMARKLTLNQRIAFSMVDMFGLNINEVGEILDISEGAVKGLLYRAHMNLDLFFSDHCNILDINNPCSCKAWIDFSKTRDNMQKRANEKNHKLIKQLDYKKTEYKFNQEVRKKINYLYKNIPNKKLSENWYNSVIYEINNMYKK